MSYLKMKNYRERKDVFRIYSTSKNGITVENIVGKFQRRRYRIGEVDKKGKEGGVYRFELADPETSAPFGIEEINLTFEKLYGAKTYIIQALCGSLLKIDSKEVRFLERYDASERLPENFKLAHQMTLDKEDSEIKFGKGVQKGLIRILEED